MKTTEEQQKELNDINVQRTQYLRTGGLQSRFARSPSSEAQAKMKEFEDRSVNVLTDEQKQIWDARKAEIKLEQEARQKQLEGSGRVPQSA